MITISPLKILIVVVVALLLLGPDKIPQAARQIGAGWSAFRRFRQRIEHEVRESVPDLPSADEIVRAVRSPVSFLDNLADLHGNDQREADGRASPDREGPAEGQRSADAGQPSAASPPSTASQLSRSGQPGEGADATPGPPANEWETLNGSAGASPAGGKDGSTTDATDSGGGESATTGAKSGAGSNGESPDDVPTVASGSQYRFRVPDDPNMN